MSTNAAEINTNTPSPPAEVRKQACEHRRASQAQAYVGVAIVPHRRARSFDRVVARWANSCTGQDPEECTHLLIATRVWMLSFSVYAPVEEA